MNSLDLERNVGTNPGGQMNMTGCGKRLENVRMSGIMQGMEIGLFTSPGYVKLKNVLTE
jgi:predicted nucleotidyltransferase